MSNLRVLQVAAALLCLCFCLPAFAHDCSGPDDCNRVVKNQAWLSAALALALALLAQQQKEKREEKEKDCNALRDYLDRSGKATALYEAFLNGEASWEEIHKHLTLDGQAFGEVTTSEPPVVQKVITQVEYWEWALFLRNAIALIPSVATWVVSSTPENLHAMQKQRARNEIERHNRIDEILKERMNELGCN
jgi:hypothetical protein